MNLKTLLILLIISAFVGLSAPVVVEAQSPRSGAKAKSKGKAPAPKGAAARGGRQRYIVHEQRVNRDKTSINFDEADLTGKRQAPLGEMLNQRQADKDFDLIKIRTDWKPEMIQSTSSSETGRSR